MNTLNLHEEFQTIVGQPILNKGKIIPEDRRKLRLNLAFEELTELAEAFGCLKYFKSLCNQLIHTPYNESKDVYNETEVLDALVDIEVINNGTILETGFKDVFYDAYKQTHDNNISKSHETLEELQESHLYHESKGLTGLSYKEINGRFILYNSNKKVIKPKNYVPNDLSNFTK